MFEGFATHDLETTRGTIHARVGGDGPPLLVLHGYPQTHLMWHAAAPLLAERFTVVAADLSGYGDSFRPAPARDHAPHSKRALARDQVEAMAALGYERFAVAGHDRGGRVAYRMALDHPDRVSALAVLDIVPTAEVWGRADARMALMFWHWGFLAHPAPLPERLIAGDPDAYFDHHLRSIGLGTDPARYPDPVMAAYRRQLEDPSAVEAICEDYRAGATHRPRAGRGRPRPPDRMPAARAVGQPRRARAALRGPARSLALVGERRSRPRNRRVPLPRGGPPRGGRLRAAGVPRLGAQGERAVADAAALRRVGQRDRDAHLQLALPSEQFAARPRQLQHHRLGPVG